MTTTFELTAQPIRRQGEILTPEALEFIERLHRALGERRTELLDARHGRRARIAGGEDPQFPHGTEHIREDRSWRVAPPAPGLNERRVELAGPTDRRTTISALNSGASVWVADFEDSLTPSWRNIISGQLNLMDALERRIDFTAPDGTELRLTEGTLPTIVMRPRGLHLPEKHLLSGGQPVSGSIVDFGLYFFHNARRLLAQGRGPYFYLPKVETHQEARWWNDLFILAQDLLGLPQGTIRATVLIETISAAFEMEEILYELRALGLHLLPHQDVPDPRSALRPPGPLPDHHGAAVHPGLLGTAGAHLPQAGRHGDRRHVRRGPEPAQRRAERPRHGCGPRGHHALRRGRVRRHLGGAS